MAISHPIPVDVLRQLLRLDPETGKLYWRERGPEWASDGRITASSTTNRWNGRYAGAEALTADNGHGYQIGSIFGRPYLAHRVVFALTSGHWPTDSIDHRDGDRMNNRPENLREANHHENGRNSGSRGGTSTYKGVSWHGRTRTWRVRCRDKSGAVRYLGYYTEEKDAAAAYDRAAKEWHGEYARLNFPDGE